jgi:ribonuclease P protein component
MLARELRLNLGSAGWRHSRADFTLSTPLFRLLVKKTAAPAKHFGFLVTGKIGKAATRNLARRHLAEAVKESLDQFPEMFDYIFIAYPSIAGKSHEEIRASLNKVLPKVSLLR